MVNIELFRVNNIYKHLDTGKTERILWIDKNYTYCYSIILNIEVLIIKLRDIGELTEGFEQGHLEFILDDDECKYLKGLNVTESSKKLLETSWEVVTSIACRENEPYVFHEKYRSEYIKSATEKFNLSKATVYKYLRKYWQGGKLKVALLPELYKCGGKGKEKKLGVKKVGRKNDISEIDPDKIGVNITEEMKKIIRISIKKFYLNHKEISLDTAYKMMKAEYFTEKRFDEDGNLIESSILAHKIPTYSQFKYWYYKERDIKNTIIKRKSEKDFKLNHNSLRSNAKYHSFGPGYIYEIDSTIFPIYLINRIKNDSIGRPVVYYVIDVFSKLIAGINVEVGYASYEGAVTALYNCVEDKVEFCKRYGLSIAEDEWVNTGLPNCLRGDRGELAGKLPESIIKNLNIIIENTASYMGNMKGTVEGNFNEQQNILKPYLDGMIENDFRKRGGSDARKTATMNIEEFTRCVIRAVLYHNKKVMDNYPLIQKMIDDDVKPSPNEIWKWGIKNISGSLRSFPETFIKLNLMRQGKASITRKGVEFLGRAYRNNICDEEGWSIRARNSGNWKVDVRYDPRCLDSIYIIDEKINRFLICYLREEETIYRNRTYDEMVFYSKSHKLRLKHFRDEDNENYLELHNGLKDENKQARKNVYTLNKKVLTQDIKRNKKEESFLYDKRQSFSLVNQERKNSLKTNKDYSSNNKSVNKSSIFNEIVQAKKRSR